MARPFPRPASGRKEAPFLENFLTASATAEGRARSIRRLGKKVADFAFVVDPPGPGGRKPLERLGMSVHVPCEFEGA
ncbi:MAG: hypothetical protein ACKVPY_18050 [Paracoccaceae bacterium]